MDWALFQEEEDEWLADEYFKPWLEGYNKSEEVTLLG